MNGDDSMNEKPLQILIVEDDFLVRTEIKRTLKQSGHHVLGEASNGKIAVEKTIELSPDVILMDIEMNVMNGIDAAGIIQSQKPTPIIFLTAHESADIVEMATKAGASAYLTKPPNRNEIDRSLMIALARHTDIMELRKLNTKLEKQRADLELALAEIKTLQGIIPICSYCKKVRDDKGYWDDVDNYIRTHTDAQVSHGICPDCLPLAYKDAGLEEPDLDK
jgi:AmiR/NasT family two-component response regulator